MSKSAPPSETTLTGRRITMANKKPSILIVDDELPVCELLYDSLTGQGYLCATSVNGNDALTRLVSQDFDVVLLDIRLPEISGMEVLRRIRSEHRDTVPVMITAVNDVDTAVEAMKLGAADYIVKPFDLDRVDSCLRTVLAETKCLPKVEGLESLPPVEEEDSRDVGYFKQMNAIARGVETKLDSFDGHSEVVTQKTIEIARQLSIPEKAIESWATARARLISDRDRQIEASLKKLERNPIAQVIMGMTELHLYKPRWGECQN